MNKADEILEQYEKQIKEAQLGADSARLGQAQQEMYSQENQNMFNSINDQLDLQDVLDNMHNLLKGYIRKRGDDGSIKWVKPDNNDLIVLSDYGVSYIMWMLQGYLTKNTLLSNYDDKQIAAKMEDFSITLSDCVFMEYDKMFLEPTLEECKEELKRRIRAKVEIKSFAMELMDKKPTEEDRERIEERIINEMADRIEREMDVIKEQKRKNKLKRFESIIRMVQDTVHSAYQRAWKGGERTSARSHVHVTETKGNFMPINNQGGFNPFGINKERIINYKLFVLFFC